jgi:hypothetical protein
MEFLRLHRTLVIFAGDHTLCEFVKEKIDIRMCNCRSVLLEVWVLVHVTQEATRWKTIEC